MALRRSVVLRLSPDERGPFPHYAGRQWIAPPTTGSNYYAHTKYSPPIPNETANTEAFVLSQDRKRMKYFLEHRHVYMFHTRKVPEFWKNYRFYYRLGESLQEWRENRVRARIEELFMNDAVQCSVTEAFEVKRVADRLVTLIKDGSRSSRRILQEFFEVKNWDGGRRPRTWEGVGEAGDMRPLYKALDDFPQRFKNRNGNYTLMTPTHTQLERKGGPFLDPDQNRNLLRRTGTIAIVEMKDRDLSIFHRGQLITGDKGEDVWDHDKDRPLLDTHRGFEEQPIGLQVEDEIKEKEERERNSRGTHDDFVADPSAYVGYQKMGVEYDSSVPDLRKRAYFKEPGIQKSDSGKLDPNQEEMEEWPTDLVEVEQYIKTMRFNATKRQLYKNENFYKMFPSIGEPAWIDKIYKPFMKMTPERQAEVYQVLENINIHNQSRIPLTEGLPFPKVLEENALQEHYRKTWKSKLEFLESFPHNDPRDREYLCPAQRDALEGKLDDDDDDDMETKVTNKRG